MKRARDRRDTHVHDTWGLPKVVAAAYGTSLHGSATILGPATPGADQGTPDILVEHTALDHPLPGMAADHDLVGRGEAANVRERSPSVHEGGA